LRRRDRKTPEAGVAAMPSGACATGAEQALSTALLEVILVSTLVFSRSLTQKCGEMVRIIAVSGYCSAGGFVRTADLRVGPRERQVKTRIHERVSGWSPPVFWRQRPMSCRSGSPTWSALSALRPYGRWQPRQSLLKHDRATALLP
jgi:hypothetical protein